MGRNAAALFALVLLVSGCSSSGGSGGGAPGGSSGEAGGSGEGGQTSSGGSGGATGGATGGSPAATGGLTGAIGGNPGGAGGSAGRAAATGGSGGLAGAPGAGGRRGAAGSGGAAGTGLAGAGGGAAGGTPGGGGAGPHVCGTGAEDADVVLTCTGGQVITGVAFASYGTPSGTCGAFKAGNCNATDSVDVVKTLCVGRSTCTIPARNDVFGEPCSKTTKSFAVEVTCGPAGSANSGCPFSGHVTYTLSKSASPTSAEQAAYARITIAMDAAVAAYNCYANITKADTVTYNTGVQTADGNVNGSIRFGPDMAYMTLPTAMHEIAHTVGIGSSQFGALVSNGIFTGSNATTQLRAITGVATDQVHGDTQHFWPYGLNYDSEYRDLSDAVNHCKMVTAIRKDMGMN